jgi:ribosomal protein S18 acetylase RimI-like enzyme
MKRMERAHKPDNEPALVNIDLAVPTDAEEIVRISKDTWKSIYASPENGVTQVWVNAIAESFNADYIVEKLENNQNNSDHIFIVAKGGNGKILGYLQGIKKPEYNELRSIYLDVKDIGSGTGGRLMEYFLNWADSSKPSQLEVASYNERAKGFYEHFGFTVTNEQIEKFLGVMPQTRMIRPPQNNT